MVISGHLLYCFMLFYFLFYTDDVHTASILALRILVKL
jgi:hypothetical protein